MTVIDIDRVLGETFVETIDFRDEMTSTNDVAIEAATNGSSVFPSLTIAKRQLGGRGRGTNAWWAADGALTFSLTIDANEIDLQPSDWPKMSLTTGLSICDTIECFLRDRRVHLKWPNDVFLDRRKVCGVLIETIASRPNLLVIGIGINVNNSFEEAPSELQKTATSLIDTASKVFHLTDVLSAAIQNVERRISDVISSSDELTEAWRSRCYLEGRTVTIDLGSKQMTGRCHGIDSDGALMIQSDGGIERFFAGVITQIL